MTHNKNDNAYFPESTRFIGFHRAGVFDPAELVSASPPPRLTSHPFPAYRYVPGKNPHPISDPTGHSYGQRTETIAPADNDRIRQTHLGAIDLFNHGYYWEAHEAWESLWIAFGRSGTEADFIKGLIKLAAAGVKACAGSEVGVQRHAKRAAELFRTVQEADHRRFEQRFGLSSRTLESISSMLADHSDAIHVSNRDLVIPVMPRLSFRPIR